MGKCGCHTEKSSPADSPTQEDSSSTFSSASHVSVTTQTGTKGMVPGELGLQNQTVSSKHRCPGSQMWTMAPCHEACAWRRVTVLQRCCVQHHPKVWHSSENHAYHKMVSRGKRLLIHQRPLGFGLLASVVQYVTIISILFIGV